jgi:hypothetical protein
MAMNDQKNGTIAFTGGTPMLNQPVAVVLLSLSSLMIWVLQKF